MTTKISIILMSVLLLLTGMLIGTHGEITIVRNNYEQRPLRIITAIEDVTTGFTIHIDDNQIFNLTKDYIIVGNPGTQLEPEDDFFLFGF